MKLAKIEINDFRGFPGPRDYTFDLGDGKNLLVYGENGSGKSSLYRSLVEFLNLDRAARSFEDHRSIFWSNPPANNGHVTLELIDGSRYAWRCGGDRPLKDTSVPQTAREQLIDVSRRSSLLEYRSLLQTNFGQGDLRERLFRLAVDSLLANVPVTTAGGIQRNLRQLWTTLEACVPMRHTSTQLQRVADATLAFNDGFRGILPDIEQATGEFLRRFTSAQLTVRFELPGVRYNRAQARRDRQIVDQYLDLEVSLRGSVLPQWSTFLNEARLSALALSLYLASAVLNNPAGHLAAGTMPLRILALDDVLIGLDLEHRLPILDVIEDRFADYQVILLTYDRVWFELAQWAFRHPERWAICELHSRPHNGAGMVYDVPVLKSRGSGPVEQYLARAVDFLDIEHDPRTAAFYARVAFETKLKQHCKKHKVPVPYDPEERGLNTDDFLNAIERAVNAKGLRALCVWSIGRVKLFRKGVLNPLSHSHPITITESEVRAALNAVKELTFHDPPGTRDTYCIETAVTKIAALPTTDFDRLDAACWLRTAFESDVRRLLLTLGGLVKFRIDWTAMTLNELWDAAKETMRSKNPVAATALVADIEAHSRVFLNEWDYNHVFRLTEQQLRDALAALQDTSKANPTTRLVPFS